jgi:hypothetical protein
MKAVLITKDNLEYLLTQMDTDTNIAWMFKAWKHCMNDESRFGKRYLVKNADEDPETLWNWAILSENTVLNDKKLAIEIVDQF